MDQALVQKSTIRKNHNDIVEYDLDSNGVPVMPDHLVKFSNMVLDPDTSEGRAQIDGIASAAFDLWRDNDFQPVQLNPKPNDPAPACYGLSPKQATIFDGEYPDPDDYSSNIAYERAESKAEIHIAAAKKMCSECPLAAMCLTSSITRPQRGRDHQIKTDAIGMEQFGIWGGWGSSAREMIIDRFAVIWGEEDTKTA